jgi:tetratricopeptide (TPR) repeat protein
VTHNPLYHHLVGRSFLPKLDALQAALDADGIKIVRMERYMPIQLGQAEWFKWYNLPNDGHWSEAGAHVYAAAMAKAVHHYLLGADTRDGENGASPCESVFQAAETVLRKGAPPDAAETRTLTDLVQSLRPRARMLYAGAETYAGCGFIPDLFARLGDGLFAQSHKEAAVNAWTASLDLAPARYALRRTLGQSLIAMGRYAQAESELGRLIDDGQDNADIRFMRGNARYRQQEFAAAVKDYSRGLELRPGNAGLLIQRAAARYELGAFADALGDADAAIAAGMDTPYARSVRTRIVEAEKKSGARPTPK